MSYDPNQAPQPQWDPQQGRWVLPEQGGPRSGGGQPGYGQQYGYGQPQGQYGQQGPGGPQYPGQPQYVPQPPPQPKRRKWPWIVGGAVLLLVIIGIAGGGGTPPTSPAGGTAAAPTAAPAESSSATPSSEAAGTGEVVYEVTGSGRATSISYGSNGGISQANGESLPWSETAPVADGFGIYSLTAQNNGSGEITCRITVDGEEVARQTSTGQYAVVSCTGDSSPF